MRKAYIILAHKNAEQVRRLVSRLADGHSSFFIHVDLRAPFGVFERLFRYVPLVTLVDRVRTEWAGFGLVQATLNAMQAIKKTGKVYDHIILLSGQDYPIKSNAEIDLLLARSESAIFMEYYPLPNYQKWTKDGGSYRVDKYFFGLRPVERLAAKTVNFLGRIFPAARRRLPRGMDAVAGSQWWIIDQYTLDYLLLFIKANPWYSEFHKNTFAADEVFFQMILVNNHYFRKRISNNTLRFMKWRSSTSPHPEQLRCEDWPVIRNSGALFARKFDETADHEILDLIDQHLQTA